MTTHSNDSPLLQTALAYLRAGKPVFSVDRETKRPLVAWREYQKRLPTEAKVRKWWSRWPEGNLGMATGHLSGVIVVDCDSPEAVQRFTETYPEAQTTKQVETGRGRHFYFRFTEGIHSGKFSLDVDIKAEGGLVVISPSLHANGTQYCDLNDNEPQPLPEALKEALTRRSSSKGNNDNARVLPALERVLERLPGATPRNGGWQASCPVPEHGQGNGDAHPSLSVSLSEDGKALVHCHAGCVTERVLEAVGLTMADLCPSGDEESGRGEKEPSTQTLERFLSKKLLPKEPLIDGVLYRRDLITLVGRRRHGKTTLIGNLALSLAVPTGNFLGYSIQCARRVIVFYLEDDPGELQDKLRRMAQEKDSTGRFHLYTKRDFFDGEIPIDVANSSFQKIVKEVCRLANPDLIVFDNMAHLIGADYNESKKVHTLISFVSDLAQTHNAAMILAAHPRKHSKGEWPRTRLKNDPEQFFEECMGSSHLINSTGSLWGTERNLTTDRTTLLLGAQRATGMQSFTVVEKDDNDWFHPISDYDENLALACHTPKRKQAWDLLPSGQPLGFNEAFRLVGQTLKSKTSFSGWWGDLKRLGLLEKTGDGSYVKVGAKEAQ